MICPDAIGSFATAGMQDKISACRRGHFFELDMLLP